MSKKHILSRQCSNMLKITNLDELLDDKYFYKKLKMFNYNLTNNDNYIETFR